jgi:hypothetical protein
MQDQMESLDYLMYILDKQEAIYYANLRDQQYSTDENNEYLLLISTKEQEISQLNQELILLKAQRQNMIEYEEKAKAINELPTLEKLQQKQEDILKQLEIIRTNILNYETRIEEVNSHMSSLQGHIQSIKDLSLDNN